MILPKRVSLFAGFVVLMAIFLLMGGCRKAEFIVDVQLDGGVNQTFPMLYYASDKEKGWNVDDVVEVHGGKGKLLGRTVKPTLVYIFAGGSRPQAVFYAERGDKIQIRGKGLCLSRGRFRAIRSVSSFPSSGLPIRMPSAGKM